jgi:alpha-L-rhamnosidase
VVLVRRLAEVPKSDALTPYDLRCEHLDRPLGIGERRPRLSWRLTSPRQGDAQTAYRITVSADESEVWDSGWTENAAVFADYGGRPLACATRYRWQVAVRDAAGEISGSAQSWFDTGILHSDEWQASWIEHDLESEPAFEPPVDSDEPRSERTARLPVPRYFRRTVDIRQFQRARIFITAHGLYQLWINGRRVGADELTPGWTDYRFRTAYQAYDVTEFLTPGANTIGAIVADGWWSGYVGWDTRHHGRHYGIRPQLLVQLVVDHPDGARTVVSSDGEWRERTGAVRYSDLLMGESYDARLDLGDWSSPGYDDSDWAAALASTVDYSELVPTGAQPVRVTEELSPVGIEQRDTDRWIVDFGQNIAGRVRITMRSAPAGARIRLRHGEMLDNGELYTANLRTAEATDYYVCGGAAEETYEPIFTVHGFRYVEIVGHEVAHIVARVLHSDTPVAGEFECSDAGVNQLMSNIQWGQRGNFVSVPTDCPQRDERLGWTADAQVFLPTACYNADVLPFFANWLADLACAQDDAGALPDVAPHLVTEKSASPAWGDAATIVPWHLYRAYGDDRPLVAALPMMRRWVDFVHRNNPDLIWRNRTGRNYGDWLQVGVETPRDVVATAYFAHSAGLVARAAETLGEKQIAEQYAELRDRIVRAFNSEFVSENGTISGDTQTAYVLALAFDLLPEATRPLAVGRLVEDVERRGRSITTGFLGVALICPILARYGHTDLAYALLHDDRYPSWGYSIKHGATTIWERWDGWTEEGGFGPVAMNSFNHYSLGAVGAWLYSDVAGIDQESDSVGFRRLVIRPRPGGRLTSARAAYDTPNGRVEVEWAIRAGEFALDVAIPPGVTATVHLSGRVETVGSGRHRFSG